MERVWKTQAEEGKVEQGETGMSLPRRRGKGEPGRARGEFHPRWTESSWGSRVKGLFSDTGASYSVLHQELLPVDDFCNSCRNSGKRSLLFGDQLNTS